MFDRLSDLSIPDVGERRLTKIQMAGLQIQDFQDCFFSSSRVASAVRSMAQRDADFPSRGLESERWLYLQDVIGCKKRRRPGLP